MTDSIVQFRGDYQFLSNFYRRNNLIAFDGLIYSSSEALFQALKNSSPYHRKKCAAASPRDSKRLGRGCNLRPDWEEVKVMAMHYAVTAKFRSNPDLAEQLLATGSAKLIEGNTWNDTFWGVHYESGTPGVGKGVGQNQLGRVLEWMRTQLFLREEDFDRLFQP